MSRIHPCFQYQLPELTVHSDTVPTGFVQRTTAVKPSLTVPFYSDGFLLLQKETLQLSPCTGSSCTASLIKNEHPISSVCDGITEHNSEG